MDLGALDSALDPWRRQREAKAWSRVVELREQEKRLRHEARTVALTARAALGALGEQSSSAKALNEQADRAKALGNWWRVCRLVVKKYEVRRRACGEWAFQGECQHCGMCHTWPRACGATQVCAECAKRKSKRIFRKLVPAIRLQSARAMTLWHANGRRAGKMPILTMMTLTVRSVDLVDLEDRRKLISVAWNRFRTWYAQSTGRKLSYAWTAECTDGGRNQGHVHLHVITLLPKVDYVDLSASWSRAVGEQGGHIQFSRARTDPKKAAWYVAKYASKGVKFKNVQTAASWVRAQHGRRGVSTSQDWWWTDPVAHGPWVLRLVPGRASVESDDCKPDGGTSGHTSKAGERARLPP